MNNHPIVALRFRSIVTPSGRIPMVQVTDVKTGEILMVELMRATAEWLTAMGYEWREGSLALWQKKGEP